MARGKKAPILHVFSLNALLHLQYLLSCQHTVSSNHSPRLRRHCSVSTIAISNQNNMLIQLISLNPINRNTTTSPTHFMQNTLESLIPTLCCVCINLSLRTHCLRPLSHVFDIPFTITSITSPCSSHTHRHHSFIHSRYNSCGHSCDRIILFTSTETTTTTTTFNKSKTSSTYKSHSRPSICTTLAFQSQTCYTWCKMGR